MYKKFLRVFIYIIFLSFLNSCQGIFFPTYFFDITPLNDTPSYSSSSRFENINNTKEFAFWFSQAGNNFKKKFIASIFVKKPYKSLFIKKISYKSDYGSGILLEDASFMLPNKIVPENTKPLPNPDHYFEQDGFFWCMYLIPQDTTKSMPEVDLQKIFQVKKAGTSFKLTITLDFAFDDEKAKSIELNYRVYTNKNSYTSPFMGY